MVVSLAEVSPPPVSQALMERALGKEGARDHAEPILNTIQGVDRIQVFLE